MLLKKNILRWTSLKRKWAELKKNDKGGTACSELMISKAINTTYLAHFGGGVDILFDTLENRAVVLQENAVGSATAALDFDGFGS